MPREDYKQARRHLTGNMPTGEYKMADMEFTAWRKLPMEWIVTQLAEWPKGIDDDLHATRSEPTGAL